LPASTGAIFEQRARAGPPRDSRDGSTLVSIFAHSGEPGERFAGYEAIHMIRKGQARWSAAGAKIGLLHRFIVGMFGMEA
jgi:hypothetical protein